MDKVAKQQACQLLIEQEIEEGLKAGKTKYAIGKEIATWVKKLFDAEIKPNTIEQRAHRIEKGLLTNVSNPIPTYLKDEPVTKESDDAETEEKEWQESEQSTSKKEEKVGDKNDSGNLSLLKWYWKRASKADKKRFLDWIEQK